MGDYIDLAFFESYTRTTYDGTTTPTDTEVNLYIDMSEDEINEVTGRSWASTTYTDELYDCPNYEILLKNYPVISVTEVKNKNGDVLTEGIDDDYIVDGDFIVFNKRKSNPDRVYVTYNAGYSQVRADVQLLTTLLTIQKVRQSQSANDSNSKKIKVGPITIDKELGMQTVINLDSDVEKYWKRLRRLIR